jgi:hypothetical protein
MQDRASELRRIPLPRTSVNKGMRESKRKAGVLRDPGPVLLGAP